MRLRNLELKDAPLMLEWMHDVSVVGKLKSNFAGKTLADAESFILASANVQNAWLVLPALHAKIKCNGDVNGKVTGPEGLLSDFMNLEIRFCDVNAFLPEMRCAIERITEMIKKEMPQYLISSEELNNLASDSWFNVVNEYDELSSINKT